MKLKINILSGLLLVLGYAPVHAQLGQYNYKREITGISAQWHRIVLPNEVFGRTSESLTDIRIFGIKENGDTVEAPYLLQVSTPKVTVKKVEFSTLNVSRNTAGSYFTFEVPRGEMVNHIDLQFQEDNFDWPVSLEGSQDQQEWFTLLEDYRILSIKNDLIDFQFTKLAFPNSKYRYFRLFIPGSSQPTLASTRISQQEITMGRIQKLPLSVVRVSEIQPTKQTEIDIEIALPVRVSHLKFHIADDFDYYRPFTVKRLADSVQTEKGWIYNYRTLASGTLNSLRVNEFPINSITTRKLKVLIENHDNQPLSIDSIAVTSYDHELVARFNVPATYFLVYGKEKARKPAYDIARFEDSIPDTLSALTLGQEQLIEKEPKPVVTPLISNKAWLWAIMVVIIGLLGWFTLQMMKGKA
ncbi:MAG: DUF3999 family protein [Bacteroidota bacterium]